MVPVARLRSNARVSNIGSIAVLDSAGRAAAAGAECRTWGGISSGRHAETTGGGFYPRCEWREVGTWDIPRVLNR